MSAERSHRRTRIIPTRRAELANGQGAAAEREQNHGPGGRFAAGNRAGAGRRWKLAARALLADGADLALYRALLASCPAVTPLSAICAALLVNEARAAATHAKAAREQGIEPARAWKAHDAAGASSERVIRHATAMLDFAGLGPHRERALQRSGSQVDEIKARLAALDVEGSQDDAE